MILPKKDDKGSNYLSYSQISKWKKKKDYFKTYFFGEAFSGNAYTDFGTKVGEALENNDFSEFSKEEKKTLKKATRLSEFEKKITLNFESFHVTGYIDTNDSEHTTLIDYKTGDEKKVSVYEDEEYIQLVIYAAAIEQETGTLPKKVWVELILRDGNAFRGEDLTVGKDVIKIPQDISRERVDGVKLDIEKTAEEISEYYRVFNILNNKIVVLIDKGIYLNDY